MTTTLRRVTAVLATSALLSAGLPALAIAADHPHHPPRASTPPDRVAYVQRLAATTSAVPQRTAAI